MGSEAHTVLVLLPMLDMVEVTGVAGVVLNHPLVWNAKQHNSNLVSDDLLALTLRLESQTPQHSHSQN